MAVPVEQPLDLVPVGLKEAALDSPTFRATSLHFCEQVDSFERWLDGYVKAVAKLSSDISPVENAINSFLAQAAPPSQASEAVIDHDYALLAAQRYIQGARELWQTMLRGTKRYDTLIVEPIKSFLQHDLRSFKEVRRSLDTNQRGFDAILSRYMSQNKSKEASSLREDAFQLHEARKAYLKASMDFCTSAPQLRASLDSLVVRIFTDQWKDLYTSREATNEVFAQGSLEMERIHGWSREMENSERAFKRELLTARHTVEESALKMTKPSRDMDNYAVLSSPFPANTTDSTAPSKGTAEKQGWLFLRTISGKPARTLWSRRWFYVKNGIFGWLVHGTKSGGVEESEKIGVLLCAVRPLPQEDRRFCFEVKTKDTSATLQAESHLDVTDWINAFELAKRKALEHPLSTGSPATAGIIDPAFAITPPISELAAKIGESTYVDEGAPPLSVTDPTLGFSRREKNKSYTKDEAEHGDITMAPRTANDAVGADGSRDHTARVGHRLDIHKRSSNSAAFQPTQTPGSGGIASLITASHNVLPVVPSSGRPESTKKGSNMPTTSLAPSTLVVWPATTSLSQTALLVSNEMDIGLESTTNSSTPSGIMANLWGTSNWNYINRLADDLSSDSHPNPLLSVGTDVASFSASQDDLSIMDRTGMTNMTEEAQISDRSDRVSSMHRTTVSVDGGLSLPSDHRKNVLEIRDDFPAAYPWALRVQQAQFQALFPSVSRREKIVLVFRASWNPNEQQEFPGRVYVTQREIFFFSNHLGLVLTTSVRLKAITEVTAAPGRDCDFLFLHLREQNKADDSRRITVKIFLEPLRLLQRRLNYLARNAAQDQPDSLADLVRSLIRMESEPIKRSSSVESWEDLTYEADDSLAEYQRSADRNLKSTRTTRNLKANLRIDGSLYADPARTGREIQKFRLPTQPVAYTPQGMQAGITREFPVSAKALFHVIFGDKSTLFQMLYANRGGNSTKSTPWTKTSDGQHWRRSFSSGVNEDFTIDTQTIDVFNDHLCYSVTNAKNAWQLPYAIRFAPITKIVVTHTAKSRCRLAIFQQITWQRKPTLKYIEKLVSQQALRNLEADALDLSNVAMDQVAKLGTHSKTNKAIEVFGGVGLLSQVPQVDAAAVPNLHGSDPARQRVRPKSIGLAKLVVDDILLRVFSAMGWILDVAVAVGKSGINVCNAHMLLLGLLAVSALYNGWYGYRESLSWYQDRRAEGFMTRLGVRPAAVMGRVVYLADIEHAVTQPNMTRLTTDASTGQQRTCRSVFAAQLAMGEVDGAVATRINGLRRSRRGLAQSRHELLVALRVVNRVEKDLVEAAWAKHVHGEDAKCRQVAEMLKQPRLRKEQDGSDDAPKIMGLNELGRDFADYCQTCAIEADDMDRGVRLV